MSESTRIQIRCGPEQKQRWVEAAGGARKMSAWAKEVLDREARVSMEVLLPFITDERWDLDEAVDHYLYSKERDALEEEPDGKALGETSETASAEVAPEGSSSNVEFGHRLGEGPVESGEHDPLPVDTGPSPDRMVVERLWLRDGELNHLPGPNPGTPYTACGLDAGLMRSVMIPEDHAGVWCNACIAAEIFEERDTIVFNGLNEDPIVRPDIDSMHVEPQGDFRTHVATAGASPTVEVDPDDDTNPEPEDPVDFTMLEPERALTGEGGVEMAPLHDGAIAGKEPERAPAAAPPSPPAVNALQPTCVNALMHWKLTTGETCRYCGGQA